MLETLKFGEGNWANKTDSTLAYSDQYGNFQAIPFDFTRATTATRVNKQGLIESVNEGIARIDYSDSTQGALLLEPERTNLFTYSENTNNFSTLGKLNCSYSLGNGYDGFDSSCKITNNTFTNSVVRPVIAFNSVNGESNFFTLRVKKKQGWYLNATGANGCNPSSVKINLSSNGGYISSSGTSETNYVVKEFSNYYLIGFLTTQNSTTSAGLLNLSFYNNVNFNSYDLTTIEEFNITGLQWENNQSYATSYIPTTTTTVTRNGEFASNSNILSSMGQTEGTMFIDVISAEKDTEILSFNRSSQNAFFLYTNSSNNYKVNSYLDGQVRGTQFLNGNQRLKVAVAYENNNQRIYVNGVLKNTYTESWTPNVAMDRIYFNQGGYVAARGKSNISALQVFKTSLTDAQLQTLTTI